jgi:hypothetical protein
MHPTSSGEGFAWPTAFSYWAILMTEATYYSIFQNCIKLPLRLNMVCAEGE